jgi:hypothetical protein
MTMRFITELAAILSDIAQGYTHSALALTVAQALPWANADDKAVLGRFLKGSHTERDCFALQAFAVLTHNHGN